MNSFGEKDTKSYKRLNHFTLNTATNFGNTSFHTEREAPKKYKAVMAIACSS